MPLATAIDLVLKLTQTLATKDLSTPIDTVVKTVGDRLATGTGLDQADVFFHDERALDATSEELDLAGVLTDSFGNTLAFAKVKMIFIRNLSTAAGEILSVGGAATNALINWVGNATDIVKIGPDGFLMLHNPSLAGYGVTAGTGDKLKIDSGAASFSYEIIIVGTSA